MMANTTVCTDTSEAVELYEPQRLYLKPVAKVNICVQLPQLKAAGKTISNWEVMEKLKHMVRPEVFLTLKIFKSTMEFIRLEGEIENKSKIHNIILKLDGKTIKLSGFTEILKVRAAEAKVNFPSRHDWDSYFRDAKNMNEMRPGERPDTIYLRELPTRWFAAGSERDQEKELRPSESVVRNVFRTFGDVRCIDIPMLDPYRKEICANLKKSTIQTFSYGQDLTFECFIQYVDYISFVKAMDCLRGMKLLYKGEEKALTAAIKIDFDKTKHLSEKNMRRRQIEREKLEALERERMERARREREEEERRKEQERCKKEEEEREKERKRQEKLQRKEDRRKEREEKRRQKKIEKKQREEEERMQYKIALEERRLLIAQRKLESLRLLSELFERIKAIRVKKYREQKEKEIEEERKLQIEEEKKRRIEEEIKKSEEKKLKKQKLQQQEQELRDKIMKNFKAKEEQQQEKQREELRKKLAGTKKLKSAIIMNKASAGLRSKGRGEGRRKTNDKDSEDSISDDDDDNEEKHNKGVNKSKKMSQAGKRGIAKKALPSDKKVVKPKQRKMHLESASSSQVSSDEEESDRETTLDESRNADGGQRSGASTVMERVLKANRMRAWREPGDRLESPPSVKGVRDRVVGRGFKRKNEREDGRRKGDIPVREVSSDRIIRSKSRDRSRGSERSRSRSLERSRSRSRERRIRGRSGSRDRERDKPPLMARRGGLMPPLVPGPGGVMIPLPPPPPHHILLPPPFPIPFRPPFHPRGRGPRGMPIMPMRGGPRGMRGMRMPPVPPGFRGGLHVFNKSYLRKYNHFLGMANQMRDMSGRYAQPLQMAPPPLPDFHRPEDDDDGRRRSKKSRRHYHRRHRSRDWSDRSRSRHRSSSGSSSSSRHSRSRHSRSSSSRSRHRHRSSSDSRHRSSESSRSRSRSGNERSRNRNRKSESTDRSRSDSRHKGRSGSKSENDKRDQDPSKTKNSDKGGNEDSKEVRADDESK